MKLVFEKRLEKMLPSDKLKMYGQLLLRAQRYLMKNKYSKSDKFRKDAEKILYHFETFVDEKNK